MNFELSDEQRLLRESLNAWLRRRAGGTGRLAPPALWSALGSECGILGIGIPEVRGGTGGGAVEIMLVMEELGAALVTEPYFETMVLAASLLRQADAGAELAAIARGETVATLAWTEPGSRYGPIAVETRAMRRGNGGWRLDGVKNMVSWAPVADLLLVPARSDESGAQSLFAVPRRTTGLVLTECVTIDGRRAANIVFDAAMLPAEALLGEEGGASAPVERALDEGIAALCAEAVGVLRVLLDSTIAYAGQRRQFGRPIANFQALRHRMADMFLQVELASAAALLATLSLGKPRRERIRAVSAAKATIADACRFVGQSAIQLHGGMGMSEETPVTRYFKRATVIESELGSAGYHIARHRFGGGLPI